VPAPPLHGYRVAREDDFDFLSPAYRALYERSDATLFQEPVWLDRLYRTLAGARDARPTVVTVRRAGSGPDDRLVGVLPLVRRCRHGVQRLEFADLGVCDYAAPVLDREHVTAMLSDVAVRRDIRTSLRHFDLLQVERLAGSGVRMAELVGASVTRRHSYDTFPIALPTTRSQWPYQGLDQGMTRRLVRGHKRLRTRGGVTLRVVADAGEVDAVMERLRVFRQERFSESRAVDLVQDPDCFEFYRRAARDGILRGGPAQLSVLEVGGEPAAVALDLVDAHRHLHLLVGYDVVRLRTHSLGLLIVAELIRSAIMQGRHTFDLTVGNEAYKSDFGARATPMYSIRIAVTARGHVAAAATDVDALGRRVVKRGLAVAAPLAARVRSRLRRAGRTPAGT
jgi:CelD/BcsL family acetyltransferase involved in cellulose biosynthesis